MKILIDPGHGAPDCGAVSAKQLREADVVLNISRRVMRGLRCRGLEAKLTRAWDCAMSLADRVAMAHSWNADLFVSIHANAATTPTAHGYEVWTSPGQTRADAYAEEIFEAIKEAFPTARGRKDTEDGDSDREAAFYVLRKTRMPAVLVEVGFISNPEEAALMGDVEWLERMAHAISRGIG